jgi:Tol biopolymer transport system component
MRLMRWVPGLLFLLLFAGCSGPVTPGAQGIRLAGSLPPRTVVPMVDAKQAQGRIAFVTGSGSNRQIWLAAEDGSEPQSTSTSLYEGAAQWEAYTSDALRSVWVRPFADKMELVVRHMPGNWQEVVLQAGGLQPWVAWSADGKKFAFSQREGLVSRIAVLEYPGSSLHTVLESGEAEFLHPTWSPDGTQLAFERIQQGKRQVWRVNADGISPQQVSGEKQAGSPVWIKSRDNSPQVPVAPQGEIGLSLWVSGCDVLASGGDATGTNPLTRMLLRAGEQVLYDSGSGRWPTLDARVAVTETSESQVSLVVTNQSGSEVRATRPLSCTETGLAATPAWGVSSIPDGTPVVLMPPPVAPDVFAAATMAASATAHALRVGTGTPTPANFVYATPTPEPLVIVPTPVAENAATRVYQIAYATAAAFTTGTPTPFFGQSVTATPSPAPTVSPTPSATPVYMPGEVKARALTATPTPWPGVPSVLQGKILFRSTRDGSEATWLMDLGGQVLGKLTSTWPYLEAQNADSIGAEGLFTLFVRSDQSGPQIYFHDNYYNVDRQVTRMGVGSSWEGAFEPSGSRIAFVSNESGNDELYVVGRDGSGLRRLTNNIWEWDRHPTWSPDGKQIVFWSNRTGRKQLYLIAPDGSGLRTLSDGLSEDWDPVWVK